jgi:hypothetical protein
MSPGVKSMTLPSRSRGAVFGGRGWRGGSASAGLNIHSLRRSGFMPSFIAGERRAQRPVNSALFTEMQDTFWGGKERCAVAPVDNIRTTPASAHRDREW